MDQWKAQQLGQLRHLRIRTGQRRTVNQLRVIWMSFLCGSLIPFWWAVRRQSPGGHQGPHVGPEDERDSIKVAAFKHQHNQGSLILPNKLTNVLGLVLNLLVFFFVWTLIQTSMFFFLQSQYIGLIKQCFFFHIPECPYFCFLSLLYSLKYLTSFTKKKSH